MTNYVNRLIFGVSFALCSFGIFSQAAFAEEQILCESTDGGYQTCYVGREFTKVKLVDRLSFAACIPGQTFGIFAGEVWVDQGCRGIFEVKRGRQRDDARLQRCESENYGPKSCYVGRNADVALWMQLSDSPCSYGYTWGYDPRHGHLWVDRGCRADFVIHGFDRVIR
jgi:hypothetical protein